MSWPITVRSSTHLRFAEGAVLRKVVPSGGRPYAQVLINRAALEPTSAADENVIIEGLHLDANHVDAVVQDHPVPGLRGQLGFHNVRNLSLRRTRITNLGAIQFGIQVSSFDGLWIEHVAVSGKKDGVHLGRGSRFAIRHGSFATVDDAIALNAHDYATATPSLGWIEHGEIHDVVDLPLTRGKAVGFFARLNVGAWLDWSSGMRVQNADSVVVSGGGVYRVFATPNGKTFVSTWRPSGGKVHGAIVRGPDGVPWRLMQSDAVYSAGVRNVSFHGALLLSKRPGIALHVDMNKFSRALYPEAVWPSGGILTGIALQNVTKPSKPNNLIVATPNVGLKSAKSGVRFASGSPPCDAATLRLLSPFYWKKCALAANATASRSRGSVLATPTKLAAGVPTPLPRHRRRGKGRGGRSRARGSS